MGSKSSKNSPVKRNTRKISGPHAKLVNESLDMIVLGTRGNNLSHLFCNHKWIIVSTGTECIIERRDIVDSRQDVLMRLEINVPLTPLLVDENNIILVHEGTKCKCYLVNLKTKSFSVSNIELPFGNFHPYISSTKDLEFIRVSEDKVTRIGTEYLEDRLPEEFQDLIGRTCTFIPDGQGMTLFFSGENKNFVWKDSCVQQVKGDREMQDVIGMISDSMFLLEDGTPLSVHHSKLRFSPIQLDNGFISISNTNVPGVFVVYTSKEDVEILELRRIHQELRFSWQQV